MPKAMTEERGPSQEVLLADYAARLVHHKTGRTAVWLHLSRLSPVNRREHHLRIAAATCEPLARRHEGQMFVLANSDIVMVVRGASRAEVEKTVFRLRYLFAEDPVIGSEEGDGVPRFSTCLDLEGEHLRFLRMAEAALVESEKRRKEAARADLAPAAGTPPRAPPRTPVDPSALARFETQLNAVDIAPLARRQPVAAILPGEAPRAIFEELYVAVSELGRRLMPETDLAADRWLFQRLTHTLDRRLLRIVPKLEGLTQSATALNLNVATILSPQFLAFDEALRQVTRKTMLIDLQPVDIFADIGAFIFARDFVRERGYRVCLDGLNHLTFPLLLREELDFDFHKIVWSSDMAQEADPKHRQRFEQALAEAGAARVILCRCDGERAIAFGHGLGITMFQGHHVDRLLGHQPSRAGGRPAA
ncbi:MAG: hypothetical protein KIT20_08755 [Alphaproteobacteria bacterium]|nr:hypothetical protein [Alphaproteobacteria bacterium]